MSEEFTLANFFDHDDAKSLQETKRALARSGDLNNKSVPGGLRGAAAESMAETAQSLLNEPLVKIIGDAWGKIGELRDMAADKSGKTHECPLNEHEISLSRKPTVDLLINGAPSGVTLEFELKLALTISSAVLKVKNGSIVAANIGKVRGHGAFTCGHVTLAKRETSSVKMPGKLNFDPGLAIR